MLNLVINLIGEQLDNVRYCITWFLIPRMSVELRMNSTIMSNHIRLRKLQTNWLKPHVPVSMEADDYDD